MIKIQTKQCISLQDWDSFVRKIYGKSYSFQQQDGCKERGSVNITIPEEAEDFENDTVPEKVNGDQMGVSFASWLARDPKQKIKDQKHDYELELFWNRNFYPDVQMIANDLHVKGLIPTGEYVIEIDW